MGDTGPSMSGPDPGVLYVLTNDALPGLLKVGKTSKSPEVRAAELSATGLPAPFGVAWKSRPLHDVSNAERAAHRALAAYRESAGREFFRVDLPEALRLLREIEVKFLDSLWHAQRQETERYIQRIQRVRGDEWDETQRLQQAFDSWSDSSRVQDALTSTARISQGQKDLFRWLRSPPDRIEQQLVTLWRPVWEDPRSTYLDAALGIGWREWVCRGTTHFFVYDREFSKQEWPTTVKDLAKALVDYRRLKLREKFEKAGFDRLSAHNLSFISQDVWAR